MKKLMMLVVAGVAVVGMAQVLTPQAGVANDHGYGKTRPASVAYLPRTTETGYGYEDGMTAIGLTILPWAIPNSSWDVTGFRLNLGWGAYRETAALDVGAFSTSRMAKALQINLFGNYATDSAWGWQNGLVNVVSRRMCGLQIGLVNYAERLDGVQIGLLNFARSQWFFPFVNIGW